MADMEKLQELKNDFAAFDKAYREQVNPEGYGTISEACRMLDRLRGCDSHYEAYEQDAMARKGMEFEKVIFLDIDGVLNNDWATCLDDCLNEDNIVCLSHIVEATGAVIILTSSWRTKFSAYFNYMETRDRSDPETYKGAREAVLNDREGEFNDYVIKLVDLFDRHGLRVYGRTEAISWSKGLSSRPLEIRMWLLDKPFVKSYVILDDDPSWEFGWLARHFVCTQYPYSRKAQKKAGDEYYDKKARRYQSRYFKGLTEDHVKDAIHILNDYPAARDLHPAIVKGCIERHKKSRFVLDEVCNELCADSGIVMRKAGELGITLEKVPAPAHPGDMDDRDLIRHTARRMESDEYRRTRGRKDPDTGYGGMDCDMRHEFCQLRKRLEGMDVYSDRIWAYQDIEERYHYDYDTSPDNVIFVCVDGILNDGKPESAGQIDPGRLKRIASLSRHSKAGIVLYAEGYDSVKAFFAAQDKISFTADNREKEIEKLQAGADEDCRRVLDLFESVKAPLYGITEFYSDDEYGLPYSVKEWLMGHPKEFGFAVITAQENVAWGWMYEHSVCRTYGLDVNSEAAKILATRPAVLASNTYENIVRNSWW